jgi:FkbM family methyltransferase
MKMTPHGWFMPDEETHLIEWMDRNGKNVNGRTAYQWPKISACLELCGNRKTVAIDVGSHIGLWSWYLADHFDRVLCFEPVEAHRQCWQKNMEHVAHKAGLYPFALGESEGSVRMKTEQTSTGDTWVEGKGDIPMRRLDGFGFGNVGFIKVDTEGYEYFVLRGAEDTILESKPVICVEQKPGKAQKFGIGETAAVEYLKSLGYRLHREIGGDYIMVPES